MALPSIPVSEWQFHCTMCQEVFTDPVSTPCGHSFCKACLIAFWEGSDLCQCPLCKKRFEGPLELCVNTILAQITRYFKKKNLEAPGLEIRHEEKELRLPRDDEAHSCSADDLLVGLALNLEDSLCEKHNRPLELYCRAECMCICTLCVEDEHGEHTTVPVERELFNRRDQLRTEVLQVKQEILDRRKKMEDIKRRTRLSREDADKELKEGLQILNALLHSVEECQAELPKVIEGKQKAVESRAQNLLEELEQEIRDLKTRKAKLKELVSCQDHVHILQSFPSQLTPPSSKDWDDVMLHTDLHVGNVRNLMSPREENFSGKLRELMDAELQKIRWYAQFKIMRRYAVDMVLDPRTAQCHLAVSEDGKEVRYQEKMPPVPDNPERFDPVRNVLGKQMLSSGRHYWEVQVEGKISWYLGVVMASISRKGNIVSQPQNGLWLLQLKEGEILRALDDSPVVLSLSSKLKKVGVFVNYEEGEILFYDVEARSPLFSFTGNTFTGKLCLLLNPQASDAVPMILSPFSD